ncbi:MAG TPA: DegT/DnrJ/EryC1/StrS family aminotransferase [Tepidisphaeraceae bacterium]|jgi:perosamine synthetase|nr:DegT/DnrJ/EryC1/StrS family aminotransferase [Tepidisphaeraceae bacterium]
MPSPIPLSQPDITQIEIDAVVDVLHGTTLSIGPKLVEFERACAKVAGRQHGIGVNSGTSGLHLAMLAANIGPGDEVLTTPFSFVASANCILFVGAKPVFVDIDPLTMNVDVDKLEAAITPKTKAIVAVECFGHPGGMLEVEQIARRHELTLIEDCCEGFGGHSGERPIGSFGRAGVYAFYPNKQITTGEGGMIVTDDDTFAATCRALRNQGREGMAWLAHQRLGYNYRLSEINAALGVAQVSRLDEILEKRRQVAHVYMERLMTNKYLILPTLDDETHMSWFVFVVRLNDLFEPGDRDAVMQELRAEGIGCNNYFPPIHLQPYMAEATGHKDGDFPVCEYVAARTLALPFYGALSTRDVNRVCDELEQAIDKVLTGRKDRRF